MSELVISSKIDSNDSKLIERFRNQRTDKFILVLNDNELNLFKSAVHIVRKFNTEVSIGLIYIACIKHDRDIDELNQVKTVHYHVTMQLSKIVRIGTLLNTICELFHCNVNQVSIDKCNSLCMQSRYLLHLDDYDKIQYDESEIVTNDSAVLKRYLSLVIVRDIHDLIGIVKHYHYNLEDIMLNVAHYDKWRKYINDLIVNYNRKIF